MKKSLLKLAVLGALGVSATSAMAGLENLPSTGVAVAAGANQPAGTSPYIRCNTSGNYGAVAPTMTGQTACVAPNTTTTTSADPAAPNLFLSNTANVNANGVLLLTRRQNVFRNGATSTLCAFATQVQMATTTTFDYDSGRAGLNPMEVNDIAFAGFSNMGTVKVGYNLLGATTATASPVFRIGRAHTSVQMHSNVVGGPNVAANFVHLPITTSAPAASTQINGPSPLGTEVYPGSPTAAQQAAALSPNWVIYTTDVTGGADEDGGGAQPYSSWMYVSGACNNTTPAAAGTPAALTDGIVLRQTGQETQPWITVKIPSAYSPQGASATLY